MIFKAIGATTKLDLHGTVLPKEALEGFVQQINNAPDAVALNVEHDVTVPPLGKILSAELVPLTDGEWGIEFTEEIFGQSGTLSLGGQTFVVTRSSEDDRPFNAKFSQSDQLSLSLDPMNLGGWNEYKAEVRRIFGSDDHIAITVHARKAAIPDPEVIIHLGNLVAAGWFAKSIGKAVAKDLAEKISKDIASLYDDLKVFISGFRERCMPRGASIPYLFVLRDRFVVEFVMFDPSAEQVSNYLREDSVVECLKRSNELDEQFKLVTIQFTLTNDAWQVSWFTCSDGSVVGSKEAFDRQHAKLKELGKNGDRP